MSAAITTAIAKALAHLHHELTSLRSGRANPAMVEELLVEAYGTKTPLVQVAAISAPEPRLLVIQPWDPALTPDVAKAIQQSNLGISPVADGKILRLPFPAMTEDRRKELLKLVHEKAEQTRVRLRGIREEAMKELKIQERDGALSEDVADQQAKTIQQAIDTGTMEVDGAVKTKAEEIMTI